MGIGCWGNWTKVKEESVCSAWDLSRAGRDPLGLEETGVAKSLGIGPSRSLLGPTVETFL